MMDYKVTACFTEFSVFYIATYKQERNVDWWQN